MIIIAKYIACKHFDASIISATQSKMQFIKISTEVENEHVILGKKSLFSIKFENDYDILNLKVPNMDKIWKWQWYP